jgi:hypothetical protein
LPPPTVDSQSSGSHPTAQSSASALDEHPTGCFDVKTHAQDDPVPTENPIWSEKSGAEGRIVSTFRCMLGAIELLWHWLVSLTKARRRLEAESCFCAIS